MKILLVAMEDDKIVCNFALIDSIDKPGSEVTEKIKREFRNYVNSHNSSARMTTCHFIFVDPGKQNIEYRVKNLLPLVMDMKCLTPVFFSTNKDKTIYSFI